MLPMCLVDATPPALVERARPDPNVGYSSALKPLTAPMNRCIRRWGLSDDGKMGVIDVEILGQGCKHYRYPSRGTTVAVIGEMAGCWVV